MKSQTINQSVQSNNPAEVALLLTNYMNMFPTNFHFDITHEVG